MESLLSQLARPSSTEINWSTYDFIHSVKHKKLGSQKAKDLVYVHSNFRLASCTNPEYSNGPSKEWDVDPESPDLKLSLVALNIDDRKPRNGIGQSSSSAPPSTIEHASAVIFYEDYDDED